MQRQLAARRVVLTADQLASLIAPRARHEETFQKFEAHFFTIDGVLNGAKVRGALFANEAILVFAPTLIAAQELANSGLRTTIELLHKEYETRSLRMEDLSPIEAGLAQEVAGRKGNPSAPGRELAHFPKMKAMIAHIMGGLPWKW